MAKTSSVYRNLKRIAKAEKFAAKRSKLVAEIKDKNTSPEDRFKKVLKLAELPRSSPQKRLYTQYLFSFCKYRKALLS